MSTNATFTTMLNEFLNSDLVRNTVVDRDYFLKNCKMTDTWKGGTYPVPFYGGNASSVSFGSLTAAGDIAEDSTVRGQITTQPEMWGSLMFNYKDLIQHDSSDKRVTFLKNLKRTTGVFANSMKTMLSVVLTGGPHFASLTATGGATGDLVVDKVEMFEIGQKIILRNNDPVSVVGYVQAINVSTNTVKIYDARTAGSVINAAAYTVAKESRCYYPGLCTVTGGVLQNQFTSMRSVLLSNANGGDASYLGQTKATYPFLQAVNADGSDITAANILEKIFLKYATEIGKKAKNAETGTKANDCLVSTKNWANIQIALENYKGQYFVQYPKEEAKAYVYDSITVSSPSGVRLKITCLPEMDDDIIPIVDWKTIEFASNGFVKFIEDVNNPGSIYWYPVRAATGMSYIVDCAVMGDAVYHNPGANGIIYGISY